MGSFNECFVFELLVFLPAPIDAPPTLFGEEAEVTGICLPARVFLGRPFSPVRLVVVFSDDLVCSMDGTAGGEVRGLDLSGCESDFETVAPRCDPLLDWPLDVMIGPGVGRQSSGTSKTLSPLGLLEDEGRGPFSARLASGWPASIALGLLSCPLGRCVL